MKVKCRNWCVVDDSFHWHWLEVSDV